MRADAWSGIASVAVEVRGAGIGSDTWQTIALDGAGRFKLTPAAPGLIEVRVTATDRDGFTGTQTQTIRVKDPANLPSPAGGRGAGGEGDGCSSGINPSPDETTSHSTKPLKDSVQVAG